MIVEHGTLVVAADGGGAVIYRNASHDGPVRLEMLEIHDAHSKSFAQDGGSGPDGKYAGPVGGKSAIAGHDYHEQGERQFAIRLATRLDELVGRHKGGKDALGIVLFASPRFLGAIRADYSARLKSAMKAEIGKDLREAPPKQIEQALANMTGH